MNNEIKEILDAWRNKKYILAYTFNYNSAREQNDKLLDYITNLQEELEEQKRIEEVDFKLIQELEEKNEDLKMFICNYHDRLHHILENDSKTYIRENLKIVINYMKEYLDNILKGEDKMNKREYGEFHKYLAMMIYEYNQALLSYSISDKSKKEIEEILHSLEMVMKICVIERKG